MAARLRVLEPYRVTPQLTAKAKRTAALPQPQCCHRSPFTRACLTGCAAHRCCMRACRLCHLHALLAGAAGHGGGRRSHRQPAERGAARARARLLLLLLLLLVP